MPKFDEIDIRKIVLGAPNVRKIDADQGIDELAASIEEQGLLQPVIVHKLKDGFELIAGQRRLAALTKLGKPTVPAMIVDTSDPNTLMLISLIENVQRVDIDDRDRAKSIEALVDHYDGNYALVAKMLGMHEATIRKWAGYHGVPEELKKMKDRQLIGRDEATKLTQMLGPSKAIQVAEQIVQLPKEQQKKVVRGIKKYSLLEPEEVISIATRPPKEKALSIRFMSSVMTALERAAAARRQSPTETVQQIVREWLEQHRYIQSSGA